MTLSAKSSLILGENEAGFCRESQILVSWDLHLIVELVFMPEQVEIILDAYTSDYEIKSIIDMIFLKSFLIFRILN